MLYDGLLLLGVWLATLFPLVIISEGALPRAAIQSVLFIETFVFFAFFWIRLGQTIGMLAWKLRVLSIDGRALSLHQALLRFIGALLSFATFGLGYVWMLIDPGRRTWPDMVSRTEVFYVP